MNKIKKLQAVIFFTCIVALTFLTACIKQQVPAQFRKKNFKKSMTSTKSLSHIAKKISFQAIKCFDHDAREHPKSKNIIRVETRIEHKITDGQPHVVILIPYRRRVYTRRSNKEYVADTFHAIIDIKKMTDEKSLVQLHYKQKIIGEVLKMWINDETSACPNIYPHFTKAY